MMQVVVKYQGYVDFNGVQTKAYHANNDCHIDGEFENHEYDKFGKITKTTKLPYVVCKDFVKVC